MAKNKKKRTSPLMSLISPAQFVLGVFLAFVAGALFLWAFQESPVEAYSALYKGAFSSNRYIAETLLSMTPLIFGGLAVALGFRCGLFNMGVEGQIVLGGMIGNEHLAPYYEEQEISGSFDIENISAFYEGLLDEVAIFRRVLSEDEIQEMYEVGKPK